MGGQNGWPKWVAKMGVQKVQNKVQYFLLKITNCWRGGEVGRVENCHSNA
jgi:hypothetical protein